MLGVDIYLFQVALSGGQSENHMISEAEKKMVFPRRNWSDKKLVIKFTAEFNASFSNKFNSFFQ